jgi:hypothetical protein
MLRTTNRKQNIGTLTAYHAPLPLDFGDPETPPALRRKGWTLRPAARHLGVSLNHLYQVLKGRRFSRSLLARVAALPVRKEGAA